MDQKKTISVSELPEEVSVAVALALHDSILNPHDWEDMRLTLRRSASAWAFKPTMMPVRPLLHK